jgi:hypothetical protein
MGSATAMTDCELLRIDKKAMMLALHREHTFSDLFVAYLLARNIRYEEDLVDQLFNSSEKRLARLLLLLAHFGKEGEPETVKTRGYPVSDFDQRAADISVDHPRVVENYRSAHEIALRVGKDQATTEDLRTAMIHYRSLFEELVQVPTIVERKEVA